MSASPAKRNKKVPRFGKLNAASSATELPAGAPPQAPGGMKRSTKVGLVLAGTAAVAAYMATREPVCKPPNPNDWNAPANPQPCRQSSRTSSGGGRWYWTSSSSNNSTTTSTSKSTSGSTQGVVSRGGFGATGSSISGHGGS